MIKFSIIVPVYNVEKYITNCLESIKNQTYTNFEVIIVCDNSADKSEEVVDKYVSTDNRFSKIKVLNSGLSKARNIGIENSSGDYILLVDSDDYIEEDLLSLISSNSNGVDLIRFQAREVYETKKIDYREAPFEKCSGIEGFNKIVKYHFIENAWLYCYKSSFFKENNFSYMDDCIAEDYGLTPLIIAKASTILSIDYIGYNYVQRDNSLMNNNDYSKKIKKMNDMLKQSNHLIVELSKIEGSETVLSFINNSLIYFASLLNYNDFKRFNKLFRMKRTYNYILANTFSRKIKLIFLKMNAYLYYKLF